MIHVLATLTIDPSRRDEFLAVFADLTPLVLAEQGCLEYGAAVDEATTLDAQEPLGDGLVMVVEKWESVAALETHLIAPHMQAFREKTAGMLQGVTLRVLRPA